MFVDTITELMEVNRINVLGLAILFIALLASLLRWWHAKEKSERKQVLMLSMSIVLFMGLFFGNLFMQYTAEHNPDFKIIFGTQGSSLEANIVYKSSEGILVFDSRTRQPTFISWPAPSKLATSLSL